MTANVEEKVLSFAFSGSHIHVLYTAAERCELAKTLPIERVTILAFSITVSHDHLHYAGAE